MKDIMHFNQWNESCQSKRSRYLLFSKSNEMTLKVQFPGLQGSEQLCDEVEESNKGMFEDVTYADEGGRVELQSDSGDYLEVLADSKEDGHVYCVCSIKNNDGVYALKNESNVMDLSTAFDKIPGFSLICN